MNKLFYEKIRELERKYQCEFDIVTNTFYLNEDLTDELISEIKAKIEQLFFRLSSGISNFCISRISEKDEITKLNEQKKTSKKEILPEYRRNKNQDSWDDVEITNIESTGKFSYKTMSGLKSFGLSDKRKNLLYLIIKSEGIQQDSYYKHNKSHFHRLNADLKKLFNKKEKPIEWYKGNRVFEVKFKFNIYPDSEDYKTTQLTPEMEAKLQCNLEEIED